MAKYYNEGASYSTINTITSALSKFITIEGHPVGSVNIVRRFVIGIFQLRPSLPKNNVTLDPEKVLQFLQGINNVNCTLKDLTLKTVTLLALVSAQRVQGLGLMDISNIEINHLQSKH